MVIPDSSLPGPLPLLRGDITCFYGLLTSTLDSRPFSYKTHPHHGHMYFVKEFLSGHTLSFVVRLDMGLIVA